ncbi:hypothetical protein HPT27_00435 [Permianibacter sp. IMCC34836]|uniref:ATP-binding cassette domain-containing protein n=1 Tax=Permianibacter fluminis TaxID=2738515 RepID=UPI00155265BF|nr:ATP-binding cassette domain-containing protein [Permianibacter fluminis]NQD35468.1 hypothetical protein [Permianibacter fluminis]
MNWTALDLSAGQHHALRCSEESQREQWLDSICLHLQQQSIRYGLLHQQGALLGNLSTLQNILLPASWQQPQAEQALEARLHTLFAQLGFADHNALHWLNKRPNQLTSVQQRAAIIVRALLTEPTVLVCDEPWFVEQNRAELQLLQQADVLCRPCCWLVVYADALPALAQINWQHHELTELALEKVAV